MKKTFVLIVLFVLPLVVYMFFASGVTNFGRLPILTEQVEELNAFTGGAQLEGKITILGFPGSDDPARKGNAFNLNQKIYKPFFEFTDFQIVMLLPLGQEAFVTELKKDLGALVDISNWEFVYGTSEQIEEIFRSLQSDIQLDSTMGTSYVFIIDKERKLRGRKADDVTGTKYGFNTSSVADLNNEMKDDVKIILAEYRLALKKNQAERN
jgi:hypothetical protein